MAYDPTDPYRPIFSTPSLAEQKAASLAGKYAEKVNRIAPKPAAPAPDTNAVPDTSHLNLRGSDNNTGLIDVAQASMVRAGGSLADFGRSMSNYMFDTNYDDSRETGWSNPATADRMTGVSEQYRAEMQKDQHKVLESVAEGKYGQAVLDAVNVAGRTAADSFATLPEVALGAAATALTGGVAAPVLANKARKIFNVGEDVVEAYDDIKKAKVAAEKIKEANRIGKAIKGMKKLPATTAKAAGQASVLTADMVQQQTADYIEKHGEEPSVERKAVMTLGVLATTIWQPAIMAKLFIPNFKKQFIKETVGLKANIKEGSALLNIAKRVGDAAKKLTAAGAAESAQEYVQTWQEILTVNTPPEEAESIIKVITAGLQNKAYRDEAATGGLLGGAAGGATRGAISAPAVAGGTAVDLTKATAKGTAKVAKKTYNTANKSAQYVQNKFRMDLLSDTEKESIKNDYEIRRAQTDEMVSKLETKIESVSKATNYKELTANEDLAAEVDKKIGEMDITSDELADPKKLKRVQDSLIRKYRAEQTLMETSLEVSNTATLTKQMGKAGINKSIAAAKAAVNMVPEEVVAKTIETYVSSKKKAEAAIQSMKELKSSAALGIIEMGLKATPKTSKTVIEAAKSLERSDLKRVYKIIGEKNVDLAKELERIYNRKIQALKDTGQINDDIINVETLSPVIKDIVNKGTIENQSLASVSKVIKDTMAGKIQDLESVEAIRAAMGVYKNSDAYKNKDTAGRISDNDLTTLENRLNNAERRINRELNTGNIKRAAKSAKDSATKVYNKVKGDVESKGPGAVESVRKTASTWTTKATGIVEKIANAANEKITRWADGKKVMAEDSKLYNQLVIMSAEMEKDANAADPFMNKTQAIAEALRKAGYSTELDLADLAEQFPGLKANTEFFNLLESQFATDVIIEENTDKVVSTNEKPNKAFEFFKSLGLTECK